MANGLHWKEEYLNEEGKLENGSQEKEEIFFNKISEQIREVVNHFKSDNGGKPQRANHAKIIAGFTNALFRILPANEFPDDLCIGLFKPGEEYKATLRFSNANGEIIKDDSKPDLRGIALRIETDSGMHDFLMTNADPHHAKDAREAMIAIRAGVEKDIIADKIPDSIPFEDEIAGFIGALPFLVKHLGFKEAFKMVGVLKKQMKQKVESLSTETFFSRAPLAIGKIIIPEDAIAIKYRLRPAFDKSNQSEIVKEKDLEKKLFEELSKKEIKFYFEVQRFDNNENTPIEDATVPWNSPFERIAELIIPQNSKNEKELVNHLKFNPWNIPAENFRPLGSMNRARKKVYAAGVKEREDQS